LKTAAAASKEMIACATTRARTRRCARGLGVACRHTRPAQGRRQARRHAGTHVNLRCLDLRVCRSGVTAARRPGPPHGARARRSDRSAGTASCAFRVLLVSLHAIWPHREASNVCETSASRHLKMLVQDKTRCSGPWARLNARHFVSLT
jgi:hypothetical protein